MHSNRKILDDFSNVLDEVNDNNEVSLTESELKNIQILIFIF